LMLRLIEKSDDENQLIHTDKTHKKAKTAI